MIQLKRSNIFSCEGKLFFSPSVIYSAALFIVLQQKYKKVSRNLLYKWISVLFYGAKISDFGLFGCLSMVFDGTQVMRSPDYRVPMCSTFSVIFFFYLHYRSVVLKAGLFKAIPGSFLSFFLSRKASAAPRGSSNTYGPFCSSSSSSWMIC